MPNYKFYLKYVPTADPLGVIPEGGSNPTDFTNGSDHFLWDQEWHEVFPGVSREMGIEFDIWDHKYRKKLNGDLVFFDRTQTDFTYIDQIASTSVEIKLRLDQSCGGAYAELFAGYFSIVDGKWDMDRGTFTVTPYPDDTYRLIEGYGDKQFNLYDLNPSVQTYINLDNITEYAYSECTVLSDLQWQENYAPNGAYTYPYTFPDLWEGYVLDTTEVCTGGSVYTWVKVNDRQFDFGSARGLLVKDAIAHIVNDIGGVDYVSSFFENDEYPTGHPYIPIGTENYVTLTTPNPLNDAIMYQKSDLKPTSDRATKWMISFNEFMEILKNIFNIDWFVDVDGKFRIEHWSYFELTTASDFDLTSFDSGKWIVSKNKFEYEIESMPNREHFEFAEYGGVDFIGKDIVYNPISTFNRYKDNQKDRAVPVTTDAKWVSDNGVSGNMADDGWVIVVVDGSMVIQNEVGILSGESLPNAHLSWANLHDNYWRHGRVIQAGNMNGSDVVFSSYQRNIKQTEITYPTCCTAFDPMSYKITDLGTGEVKSARYRLIDGSVQTVFFYLNVNRKPLKIDSMPEPETYRIMISNTEYLLVSTDDKLIFYGG